MMRPTVVGINGERTENERRVVIKKFVPRRHAIGVVFLRATIGAFP